jgi:hypothetical protein
VVFLSWARAQEDEAFLGTAVGDFKTKHIRIEVGCALYIKNVQTDVSQFGDLRHLILLFGARPCALCANLAGKVVERDGVTPVVVGDD